MPKDKIVKICDQIIEYGFLAIVFFIPLIIDFTALTYNIVDLYRAVFFRVILTLALLAYAAKIFITGKLNYRGSNKIFFFAAFLLISFFASSFFSLHPGKSFWGDFYRQQGFYNFFNYLLFFALLILNIREFKQVKRLLIAVVASASLIAVYGLIQFLNLDTFRWSESAADLGRIFSTLGQPSFFGHFLILVLPIGFYVLFFLAKNFWAKLFIGLSLAAQLFCLVFTYSRAAWLGFLGSMVFLILVWLIAKRFKKVVLGLIGLILVGLIAIIGLNIIKPADPSLPRHSNLVSRLKSAVDFSAGGSNKMRLYFLKSAVKEIKRADFSRLLVGFGPETLTGIFIKYYQPDWGIHETFNTFPDRVHNWLFDQLLSLGFLGLLANIIFYIYFIYKAAGRLLSKRRFEPACPACLSGRQAGRPDDWLLLFLFTSLTAYFINNLFSFSLFTHSVYLFFILAVAWLIINFKEKEEAVSLRLTIFSKVLIWGALLTVSAVFIYTNNFNQVKAEIYYLKAIRSIQASDCRGILNNMERVIGLSPNNNYYQEKYLAFALDCFLSAKGKASQADIRDNILLHIEAMNDKSFYDISIAIARCYASFGLYFDKLYYDRAEKIFNELISDYPDLINAYKYLGDQKIQQGDYDKAIKVFKEAIAVLPPPDHPDLNQIHRRQITVIAVPLYEEIGRAYFKTKNYDSALEYYNKGLALDPYRLTLYKNIADIYYVQGRPDEAIAWNKRGLMLNPSDYNWPLALSLLYRDKKDLTKAREYLDQALKLAPENEILKNYYKELNK